MVFALPIHTLRQVGEGAESDAPDPPLVPGRGQGAQKRPIQRVV